MSETDNQINNQRCGQNDNRTDNWSDNRIEEALRELVQAFRESQEYIKYQEIRAKVHTDLQLEEQIHAYRRMIYEIQNSAKELDLYEETDRLERDSADFRGNPLVREYLAAELAVCRVFKHINWSIVQNIDFDVGFINE